MIAFEPAKGAQPLKFVYGEELPASVINYFQAANLVRKVLDIYGRVRFHMHEAQIHRDDVVPFEVPMLYKKGRESVPPLSI